VISYDKKKLLNSPVMISRRLAARILRPRPCRKIAHVQALLQRGFREVSGRTCLQKLRPGGGEGGRYGLACGDGAEKKNQSLAGEHGGFGPNGWKVEGEGAVPCSLYCKLVQAIVKSPR